MQDDSNAIWRFIPFKDYSPPSQPAPARLRSTLSDWFARFLPTNSNEQEDEQKELDLPDPKFLSQIAPTLDRQDIFAALNAALADFAQSNAKRAVIIPPRSELTSALVDWADTHGYFVVPAPSIEKIMASDLSVIEEPFSRGQPLLIPDLEHWFVRDCNGLSLIRALVEKLLNSEVRCLVGCASWSWNFLRHVAPMDLLQPLTLAPLDAEKLNRWLSNSAHIDSIPVAFKQADNGCPIFKTSDHDTDIERSNYLEYLAAYAQGTPGLALAYWSHSLRVAPTSGKKTEDAVSEISSRTLWVKPWNDFEWPKIPTPGSKADTFVLHAILLHGGLAPELIPRVTGLPMHDVSQSVGELTNAGLLDAHDGRLQITPLGYPCVYRQLTSEGFLPDRP
jgi:hypothetical protein